MILNDLLIPFEKISQNDLNIVGGKNSSLGEMISNLSNVGVTVPTGYATTVKAFQDFLKKNDLDKKISDILNSLDVNNIDSLQKSGTQIRSLINDKQKFIAHNFNGKYLDCGTMSGYINSSMEISKL